MYSKPDIQVLINICERHRTHRPLRHLVPSSRVTAKRQNYRTAPQKRFHDMHDRKFRFGLLIMWPRKPTAREAAP